MSGPGPRTALRTLGGDLARSPVLLLAAIGAALVPVGGGRLDSGAIAVGDLFLAAALVGVVAAVSATAPPQATRSSS